MGQYVWIYIILFIISIKFHCTHSKQQQELILVNNNYTEGSRIIFNVSSVTINMNDVKNSSVKIELLNDSSLQNSIIRFYCAKSHVCSVSDEAIKVSNYTWEGIITIKGIFLGKTKVCAEIIHSPNNRMLENNRILNECQNVIVLKQIGVADQIFTVSIAIVVTIIYVSFGACLDTNSLKEILLKPIGPIIGFCCQFILMPIISYSLGCIFFLDDVNMWLGIFFSGVSPGGGASNMWTLILKGNVNLSIVMTTISNLAAFAMMPLWIFTLGKTIFERGNLGVPYELIAIFSVSLIVPLIIGFLLKIYLPRVAKFLVRLLKPISIIILIYIMIFAVIINFYLIQLFSWRIVLAGMGLPWCGYVLSYMIAFTLRQNKADCLTISIETGLQNTGIALFLLRFSLEQPEADLTSVVPIAVGIMTVIPLIFMYLIQRFCCSFGLNNKAIIEDPPVNPNEEERIMPIRLNQIRI